MYNKDTTFRVKDLITSWTSLPFESVKEAENELVRLRDRVGMVEWKNKPKRDYIIIKQESVITEQNARPSLINTKEQKEDLYTHYQQSLFTIYNLKKNIKDIQFSKDDYHLPETAATQKQNIEKSIKNIEEYLIDHVLYIYSNMNKCSV